MQKRVVIKRDGSIQMIYDDALRGLLKAGDAQITRASHIEPGNPAAGQDPLLWYADLSPVQGPTFGGFSTREDALRAEVEWLNENHLTASTC